MAAPPTNGNQTKAASRLRGHFPISTHRDVGGHPFDRSVILICAHDPESAMGLIVNARLRKPTVADLVADFGHKPPEALRKRGVYFGGPVESGRGFVLHSPDYACEGTMNVTEDIRLSFARKILADLAMDKGPAEYLTVMGYAGWGAAQLEAELQQHKWLTGAASAEVVFDQGSLDKWEAALQSNGIDPATLAPPGGFA